MTPETPMDLTAIVNEMRHRAEEGCTGSHDGTCSDPEMEIHPEDWCNRCLMGSLLQALAVSEGRRKEQERLGTRVDEGQPRRIEPTGSTAARNEVRVSDSNERS